MNMLKKWLEKPVRFDIIGTYLKPDITLLDIGCGDKAPYSTFKYYPGVKFSGIDWDDIAGKKDMDRFLRCDLEDNNLSELPNDYYDVITMSHIIEHIANGEKLISVLVSKLKPGGIIYIETPSERSLTLPSMYGTFNFWDDSTHKRVYTLKEMESVLRKNGCTILKSRIRHNLKRILLSPLSILMTLVRDKKVNATALWDIVGFAHYVVARKNT